MSGTRVHDEELLQRLPLPLAQLYRRAQNAKTPFESHLAAYYFWESALKLLAATAVVEYAELNEHDPGLTEMLRNLARPAVGHWWEFVRRLVPVLADRGDEGFGAVRETVLGRALDDMPRATGLDASLIEVLEGRRSGRATVRLTELFERLVRYRNREIGHGAAGQRTAEFYDGMARTLLDGAAQVFGRVDVLAGRRLLFVGEVRRQASGDWLVDRYELIGESAKRVESLEIPEGATSRLPRPERVYLEVPPGRGDGLGVASLKALHPLLYYNAAGGLVYFLNSRRGKGAIEYLSYTSGDTILQDELGTEHRELLARVLGRPVGAEAAEAWAAASLAEEPAGGSVPVATKSRVVGEFELLSRLGQGGMGVVYRAWQPSLGRQVALKCLSRTGDAKAEARFGREIRALGRVEHPHLVKIFTSGSEGDQWYYAMELLEGTTLAAVIERLQGSVAGPSVVDWPTWQQTLSTVCEEGRRSEQILGDGAAGEMHNAPGNVRARFQDGTDLLQGRNYVRRVVDLVRQVAEATHALHEAGIIHRDIKPGNVMIDAEGSQAVLMDLGLAQLADDVQGKLTRTRQFVGTLRYASPEQILAVGSLDRRSDIYSLGATLWEMLTLRPMFNATEQTTTPDLMRRIQTEEPAPPRKYHPGLPRDLDAVVLRCLEKDARKRYATAAELAQELRRFLAGEPVQARPVGQGERWWRWCRRNPAPTAAAGLGLLACFAGIALFGSYLFAREQTRAAEALRREKVQTELALAEAREQRTEAERLRGLADRYRGDAERLSATLTLKTAVGVCEEGDLGRGLLLMARSLKLAPDSAADLKLTIRTGIASELPALHRLEAIYTYPSALPVAAFSPDGKYLLLGGRNAQLFSVATGQPHGPAQVSSRSVAAGAFSPDGSQFMTATVEGVIRFADTQTGEEVGRPILHKGQIKSAAYRPDGKVILVGAQFGEPLRCYDVGTREAVGPSFACKSDLYDAAYSPDGRVVATAGMDKSARLWDAEKGTELFDPLPHPGPVFAVAFSPDGKTLVTGCLDGGIRFFDPATAKPVGPILRHKGPVRGLAFSRNGRFLFTCSEDGTARLWEVESGRPVGQPFSHPSEIRRVLFSPDGTHLLTAGFDRAARLWRMAAGQPGVKTLPHPGVVTTASFSPDGASVLTGCRESARGPGEARLWNAATGELRGKPLTHRGEVLTAAFSPDGRFVVSGGNDKTARLWNALDGSAVHPPWEYGKVVATAAFSSDGRTVALGGQGGSIRLRDVASGKELASWQAYTIDWVWQLKFSPDGKTLLSAGSRAGLLWNVADRKRVGEAMKHDAEVRSAVWSPDGRRVLTCGNDGSARVWSAEDGRPLTPPLRHKGEVRAGAFHPGGKSVATAGADGTVRVWDSETGVALAAPLFHDGWVRAVAFSPDGATLATGCDDGTVRLWKGDGTAPLGAVLRHKGPINQIAFSADGKTVLTASADGTARLWDPPVAVQGDAERVTRWIQMLTGAELDDDGIMQILDDPTWQLRRRQLATLGGPPR
jgi:WD40 repeat protein/serine/threonine protein kinase